MSPAELALWLDTLDERWDRIRLVADHLVKVHHRGRKNAARRHQMPSIAEARLRYPHGTVARYVMGRCRCFPCRLANSHRTQAYTDAKRKRWRVQPIGGGYLTVRDTRDGQGEVFRTQDRTEAFARRDQLNAAEGPLEAPTDLISVRDVRKHLAWLQSQGIGPKTVSAVSGVSYSVLQRMLGYASGGTPIRRTRRSTAERILAVGLSDAAGGQKVPAGPTWDLIDCLLAAGCKRWELAVALGSKRRVQTGSRRDGIPSIRPGLQIKRDLVRATTARKVEQIHRQAWFANPRVRATCQHVRHGDDEKAEYRKRRRRSEREEVMP